MYSPRKIGFLVCMHYVTIMECIQHTNITVTLPKKQFLPAHSMHASFVLKEMCRGFFIIHVPVIKNIIWIFSHYKIRLILFHIQTLWKPSQSMSAFVYFFLSLGAQTMPGVIRATQNYRKKKWKTRQSLKVMNAPAICNCDLDLASTRLKCLLSQLTFVWSLIKISSQNSTRTMTKFFRK